MVLSLHPYNFHNFKPPNSTSQLITNRLIYEMPNRYMLEIMGIIAQSQLAIT